MKKSIISALAICMFITPAHADLERHVASNLTAALYHEIAHALVDQMNLPIFGMEENAADVFATYVLDELHSAEEAMTMADDIAFGYQADAMRAKSEGEALRTWGIHGLDQQRRWSHICLFAGADFDDREAWARALELHEDRLDHCAFEHHIADESWGDVVLKMRGITMQGELRLAGFSVHKNTPDGKVLQAAVDRVNSHFYFPNDLEVRIEPCDSANAYYLPDKKIIQICTEYSGLIAENYRRAAKRIAPPE